MGDGGVPYLWRAEGGDGLAMRDTGPMLPWFAAIGAELVRELAPAAMLARVNRGVCAVDVLGFASLAFAFRFRSLLSDWRSSLACARARSRARVLRVGWAATFFRCGFARWEAASRRFGRANVARVLDSRREVCFTLRQSSTPNGRNGRMQATERNAAAESLTRHVQLVLDNDYGLYHERRRIVDEFVTSAEQSGAEAYPHLLGDELYEWAQSLIGLDGDELDGFQREILTTALGWVDWREIANDYIGELEEERGYEVGVDPDEEDED